MLRQAHGTLGRAVVVAAIAMLWLLQNVEAQTNSRTQPNILLVVADDMGFSDIGSFGGEVATPTLDALANEGLQLTNFHVLPTCSPTRSVLLSGMDNHRAGLGTMAEFKPPEAEGNVGYAGYLNCEVAALPEVLKAGGYRTYMAGKWHLGDIPNTLPHDRGFDETFALLQGGGSHWKDRRPLSPPQVMDYRRNGQPVKSLPDDFYSTKYYTDIMLEWLARERESSKPFLAYLAYTAPHDPLHAPQKYIEKYKGRYDAGWDALRQERLERLQQLGIVNKDAKPFPRLRSVKPWNELSKHEQAEAARDMEVYAAMIDYLDEQIKRVFDYLKETGEWDNTLVLFFSDNGANGATKEGYPGQTEEFLDSFDNGLDNRGLPGSFVEMGPGWAQASMAPSRMFKGFPTEGGIRSPLLVKLPGMMRGAGRMNHSFIHVHDVMPTILDLAKVMHPGHEFNGRQVRPMQGHSVLALLQGKVDAPTSRASQVGYELFGMKAYFSGRWKILSLPKPFGTGSWQLFDLQKDPGEMDDMGYTHPDKLKQLVTKWEEYRKENGVLDISLDVSGSVK